MTNAMVLERTSNLVMPSHYVELDRDEMSYVDGGWALWKTFAVLGAVLAFACVCLSCGAALAAVPAVVTGLSIAAMATGGAAAGCTIASVCLASD